MQDFQTIVAELNEESGLARVTLDRPDSLNAINQQMKADVLAALDAFEDRDKQGSGITVRAVVIKGAGKKAFCAGADVTGFSERKPGQFETQTVFDRLREFPAPIVAKIHGYCLGGGLELALACDLRFASTESEFGFPEINLGLLPGGGGIQYVSRLAGPALAMEMALTGQHYPADALDGNGIVSGVFPAETFDEEVDAFLKELRKKPPLALRAVKDAAYRSMETSLSEGCRYDRRIFATLLETSDHEAAAAAFSEDEFPEFEGK
jgi:enoyl-CoA hydratase/carnithine racemase